MGSPLTIGVLVSGEGTLLDALAEEIAGGHVPARIGLVVADRPYVPAIEKARRRGLPSAVIPFRGESADRWARRLSTVLSEKGVELVVLAGFLAILPPGWVGEWKGRVINVHPSLLPKYGGPGMYGLKVHEAVLRDGEAVTGATVHLVTEEVDHGPILAQAPLAIRAGDTPGMLRERLRPVEVRLLIDVIRRFADLTYPLPYFPSPETSPPRDIGGNGQ